MKQMLNAFSQNISTFILAVVPVICVTSSK